MTLWQRMNQLNLSRYRFAERSGVSIEEISDLCAGKKPLTECEKETLTKLAKALELPVEELEGMKAGTTPYMMVRGEALDTLYHEAEEGKAPEEILTKEHLAELFLTAADQYGRSDEKRAHYEAQYQEAEDASLGEFICEKVFWIGKNQNVLQEYLSLQNQIEDCLEFFSKKSEELGRTCGKTDKGKYLIGVASKRKNNLKKRSKPAALVAQALHNMTSGPLNWWLHQDFQMEIPRFRELERDQRTAIFFGDLPVQGYRKLMQLAKNDHEAYLDVFEKLIGDRDIPEQLCHRTERNVYLHDRAGIMQTAVKLFEEEEYQSFVYLLVPQIEGLLRIYQGILSCDAAQCGKARLGMKQVANQINDLGGFLEYIYFAFDFCDELRNPIAHGQIIEINRERAYEVLMDAWWLTEKIDSPECGYKRCLQIVQKCTGCKNDAQAVGFLLDVFSGPGEEKNLPLLRQHLNQAFKKEYAWYGLTKAAERLDCLLRSQSLYDTIWNGGPAQYVDETIELDSETITVHNLENNFEEHRKLVELLHQFGATPKDWYDRYIQSCWERRQEFDDMLANLTAEKGEEKQETGVQTTAEN